MKKLYVILLFFGLYSVSWAQPFKGEVTIVCNTLEQYEDILSLDLSINVNRHAINKCQSWTIVPQIASSSSIYRTFPSVLINGNNKRQIFERGERFESYIWEQKLPYQMVNITKKTDTTLRYVMEIPYEDWMDDASLIIRQILTSCAGEQQLFTISLDKKVIHQSRFPYQVRPRVSFLEPVKAEVKRMDIQSQAYLDFHSGRSVIDPSFRRNPQELEKIHSTLREIQYNPDVVITGMYIDGYASPEGSYELNARLSQERAMALRNYISNNFGVNRNLIRVTSTPEDWNGLRALVEESNIDHKHAILSIIDSYISPDQKEALLRGFSSYRTMLDYMYPKLRRSDYRIDFTVKEYDVNETKHLLDKTPNLLSLHELYTMANTYPEGSADYYRVYDLIDRYYPNDVVARNNVGVVMYKKGEFVAAKRRLEGINDNAVALNNLGAIYLIEGDLNRAENLFLRAKSLGSLDADYNLSELNAKRDDNAKIKRYDMLD